MPLKCTHPINSYRKKVNNKDIKLNKYINITHKENKKEKIRNNTASNISFKKINKTLIKIKYGNYAFPNNNYNHPQYYKLNSLNHKLEIYEIINNFTI